MPKRNRQGPKPVIVRPGSSYISGSGTPSRIEGRGGGGEEGLNSRPPVRRTGGSKRGESGDHSGADAPRPMIAEESNRQLVRTQSVQSHSNNSSDRQGRPRGHSRNENRSPSSENRTTSTTDHVYSSRSQMARAREREREREREADSTIGGRETARTIQQRTGNPRMTESRTRDQTSRKSSASSRDTEREVRRGFERARDEISGFLGVDLERQGVIRLGGHEVEVYRPRGRGLMICAVM